MIDDDVRRLIGRAEELGLEELDHLTREELEPAIASARRSAGPPGILDLRDGFSGRVGYLRDYLASRLARRWNDEAPDLPIDREPLASEMRQFYLDELGDFEREVNALSLDALFTPEWLAGVRADISSWMGDDSFGSPNHAPFVAFFQDKVDGRAFLQDVSQRILTLQTQTEMTRRLRRRIEKLASSNLPNVLGALFELNALSPIVTPPNELIEIEPVLPDGAKRAEARVRVQGDELLVECTVLASIDPRLFNPAGFWYRPDEFARKLQPKLEKKAAQLSSASAPTLLFVARNLSYDNEAIALAVGGLFSAPCGSAIGAVLIGDSFRCSVVRLLVNGGATNPVPEEVIDWIRARQNAWS